MVQPGFAYQEAVSIPPYEHIGVRDFVNYHRRLCPEGVALGLIRESVKRQLAKQSPLINCPYEISDIIERLSEMDIEIDKELSPRQIEHLKLSSLRCTNIEIAERLGITIKTVEGHIYNLFERLGLNSKYLLIKYNFRHGIVPVSRDSLDPELGVLLEYHEEKKGNLSLDEYLISKQGVGLTPREFQVMFLISQAMTKREISYHCSFSEKTAEKHIQSCYEKFGLNIGNGNKGNGHKTEDTFLNQNKSAVIILFSLLGGFSLSPEYEQRILKNTTIEGYKAISYLIAAERLMQPNHR
ncbi:response regulator transcription factor [Candidatus Woesearchaeota archaeon]|nr:response regulator transcription factor [Candidatus Woesearchaeota archaeon]